MCAEKNTTIELKRRPVSSVSLTSDRRRSPHAPAPTTVPHATVPSAVRCISRVSRRRRSSRQRRRCVSLLLLLLLDEVCGIPSGRGTQTQSVRGHDLCAERERTCRGKDDIKSVRGQTVAWVGGDGGGGGGGAARIQEGVRWTREQTIAGLINSSMRSCSWRRQETKLRAKKPGTCITTKNSPARA